MWVTIGTAYLSFESGWALCTKTNLIWANNDATMLSEIVLKMPTVSLINEIANATVSNEIMSRMDKKRLGIKRHTEMKNDQYISSKHSRALMNNDNYDENIKKIIISKSKIQNVASRSLVNTNTVAYSEKARVEKVSKSMLREAKSIINTENMHEKKDKKTSYAHFFSRASNPLALLLHDAQFDIASNILGTQDMQLLFTFACSVGVFIAVGVLFSFHLHLGYRVTVFLIIFIYVCIYM